LTITGTNTYSDDEEGDSFTGAYTRTKTGTDEFTIVETGTKVGGSYSQTITGEDEYTLVDVGDHGTGHYTRTIDGGGSYSRTTTGAGATLPTDTGTTAYGWDQEGDPESGVFDLTQTGTTRYSLLEDFYHISNTSASQAMGHMNVYAFGQTFVDPDPPDNSQAGPPTNRWTPPITQGPTRIEVIWDEIAASYHDYSRWAQSNKDYIDTLGGRVPLQPEGRRPTDAMVVGGGPQTTASVRWDLRNWQRLLARLRQQRPANVGELERWADRVAAHEAEIRRLQQILRLNP
jgi:hypothetical protein